jgi:dTDP-4-dehydrorhamnose reductase
MRILIIGASGFLGRKLIKILSKNTEEFDEVVGTYYSRSIFNDNLKYYYLDALSKDAVEQLISKIDPNVIIHLVANPNPDACEVDKENAYKINVKSTEIVAKICQKKKIKLVYTSTDYVFDGTNPPYKEEDEPNPLNWYGKTKLIGENIVRNLLPDNHLIVRLPLLYGYSGYTIDNFVLKVINSLRSCDILVVDNKRIRYPTLIDDVSVAIQKLIKKNCVGTYHISSSEGVTKYEFALRIAKIFNLPCQYLKGDYVPGLAKRPFNSKLDTTKLLKTIKVEMHNINNGLDLVKKEMNF